MTASFKPEVQTDSSGKWYGNALRFASREEAEAYARDLASRWFAVLAWRVSESSKPVAHAWIDNKLHMLPLQDGADVGLFADSRVGK